MELHTAPVAATEMMIRRPIAEVFEAFVDPAITTKFWFSRSSGRLEEGKRLQWDWEMYGVSTQLTVKAAEPHARIVIEWDDPPTTVEWRFSARADGNTFVSIVNSGFAGDGDSVVRQAIDSAGGFTLVLAGLKALLEHGVELNLIADHSPDSLVTPDA